MYRHIRWFDRKNGNFIVRKFDGIVDNETTETISFMYNKKVITLDKKGKPADEKMLVRWRVNFPGERIESWRDQSLFNSFIAYSCFCILHVWH
jgi:hypothetical protein